MPHEMMLKLLRSQKIVIPYEVIQGGKQVAMIVAINGSQYDGFDLFDDENQYLGPLDFRPSRLSSEEIGAWVNRQDACYECIAVHCIRITRADFLLEERPVSVIDEINLLGTDGSTLQLRREGAAYPYALLLTAKHSL